MTDVQVCYQKLVASLQEKLVVSDRHAYWEGRLSSSALSTALAIIAISQRDGHDARVKQGLAYLQQTQLENGSWGDTDNSPGNTSTSLLVWAAYSCVDVEQRDALSYQRLVDWLCSQLGSLDPNDIARHVIDKYGSDKTFSVPILMALAIANCLGAQGWKSVPQLPFELAAFPQSLYAALRLPVVSYALPALIAIGLVRHTKAKSTWSPMAYVRSALTRRCLKKLTNIQPDNGGFLEATPLTAFVCMALCQAGLGQHAVVEKACAFLIDSQRDDGSWPIDTNLATWVTSLSVHALADAVPDKAKVRSWYLDQQYTEVHPFTGAKPGAWAWTNLPGAVPDADDTSAAILALCALPDPDAKRISAAVQWLIDLQNSNGGMPTFCRGWGTLPFDQSCVDISAHAVRALSAALMHCPERMQNRIHIRIQRLLTFIAGAQQKDGSFLPLWFGNQLHVEQANPVLGTSRVILALSQDGREDTPFLQRALSYLSAVQNADGSWGAAQDIPGTVEETALAVEALASLNVLNDEQEIVLQNGVQYLCAAWEKPVQPQPIGLYFASLWYYEDLYPLCLSVAALRSYNERIKRHVNA